MRFVCVKWRWRISDSAVSAGYKPGARHSAARLESALHEDESAGLRYARIRSTAGVAAPAVERRVCSLTVPAQCGSRRLPPVASLRPATPRARSCVPSFQVLRAICPFHMHDSEAPAVYVPGIAQPEQQPVHGAPRPFRRRPEYLERD